MTFAANYRTVGALVTLGASLMAVGILLHARPEPALEERRDQTLYADRTHAG